jgi:hypothetical protein
LSPRARPRKNKLIARAAARVTSPLVALLLLIPAAALWAVCGATLKTLHLPRSAVWPVAAGAACYGIFQAFFSRPMGLYVFGHELTHAVAAWMSGYRVRSMKVSSSGGEVVTSDTNLFVALAPYCVPLYTVILAVVWAVLLRTNVVGASAYPWFAFGVGLTFAFHLELTLHALRQQQPDLKHGGVFLSLVIILLCNGVAMVLLMKLLFPAYVDLNVMGLRWMTFVRDAAILAHHALMKGVAAVKGQPA